MDRITSRKNAMIARLRALGADGAFRAETGQFLCDGYKLLDEAIKSGAEITAVLWKEGGASGEADCEEQFLAPPELFDYASPMKNSPGPLFSVRRGVCGSDDPIRSAIILENVQDPGNVGTVLRTASAFGVDAVGRHFSPAGNDTLAGAVACLSASAWPGALRSGVVRTGIRCAKG